eukprot:TRINITY_DN6053_c0_g2_i1.p3 TRINITY_DN6053_c0_g2~~TRINITY_DN6053_c0_g2_i1.p3  ORF type:complete len:105 (-),score=17.60 TRINITY_DN6053_c0_g2_i1:689-1003(-)
MLSGSVIKLDAQFFLCLVQHLFVRKEHILTDFPRWEELISDRRGGQQDSMPARRRNSVEHGNMGVQVLPCGCICAIGDFSPSAMVTSVLQKIELKRVPFPCEKM